jgi:hypothetical protein
MKIILSRCDRCRKAYLEEQHKTTPVSYSRIACNKETFDLCDECLVDLIASLAKPDDNKPLYIPAE